MMTLLEIVAREGIRRQCTVCGTEFTDGDWIDYYCKVCRSCFAKWEEQAGAPIKRYSNLKSTCAACGSSFEGGSFPEHRRFGGCRSPADMGAVSVEGILHVSRSVR